MKNHSLFCILALFISANLYAYEPKPESSDFLTSAPPISGPGLIHKVRKLSTGYEMRYADAAIILNATPVIIGDKTAFYVSFRKYKKEYIEIESPFCSYRYYNAKSDSIKIRDHNAIKLKLVGYVEHGFVDNITIYDSIERLKKLYGKKYESKKVVSAETYAESIDTVTDIEKCLFVDSNVSE